MNVLVAGSHGAVGRILVKKLVARGHKVTGIVRAADQMRELDLAGAKGVVANLTEQEKLAEVVANQDTVIFAAGSKGKALEAVDRDGAIHLCDVTKKAEIRRFVLLSSIYAGRPDQGPENLQRYLYAKNAADAYVTKSGLDYTILRPGYLNNEPGTGKIQLGDAFEGTNPQISREDVAEVIATSLVEPKTIGAVFEFINGETPIADALATLK